jgi:hypothetical protein
LATPLVVIIKVDGKSKLRRFGDCKLLKYPIGGKKKRKQTKTNEIKDQNNALFGKIRVFPSYQNGAVLVRCSHY